MLKVTISGDDVESIMKATEMLVERWKRVVYGTTKRKPSAKKS